MGKIYQLWRVDLVFVFVVCRRKTHLMDMDVTTTFRDIGGLFSYKLSNSPTSLIFLLITETQPRFPLVSSRVLHTNFFWSQLLQCISPFWLCAVSKVQVLI